MIYFSKPRTYPEDMADQNMWSDYSIFSFHMLSDLDFLSLQGRPHQEVPLRERSDCSAQDVGVQASEPRSEHWSAGAAVMGHTHTPPSGNQKFHWASKFSLQFLLPPFHFDINFANICGEYNSLPTAFLRYWRKRQIRKVINIGVWKLIRRDQKADLKFD